MSTRGATTPHRGSCACTASPPGAGTSMRSRSGSHSAGPAPAPAPTRLAPGAPPRVLAPHLLGHGSSPHDPPWRIADHVAALDASVDGTPATWIGHSFGARLALERAARRPETVERLVLRDPAVVLAPHVALWAAENARPERRYASFEEAIDRRYEESQLHRAPRALLERELQRHMVEDDGGWRYPYSPGWGLH